MDISDSGITCDVCQSKDFFEENGSYWCKECHTMSQNFAVILDECTQVANDVDEDEDYPNATSQPGEDQELTTYELLTKVLRGLISELIDLGVSPNIQKVAKILWLNYLTKSGLILNQIEQPLLPANFKERDVEILYGVDGVEIGKMLSKNKDDNLKNKSAKKSTKKKRTHKELMQQLIRDEQEDITVSSQQNEGTLLNKTTQEDVNCDTSERIRKIKLVEGATSILKKNKRTSFSNSSRYSFHSVLPENSAEKKRSIISAMDVVAILKLALMFTESRYVEVGDLYRLASDGYISLGNIEKFVPEKYRHYHVIRYNFENLTRTSLLLRCASICSLLKMKYIKTIDVMILIKRYIKELQLPNDILKYVNQLFKKVPQPQELYNLYTFRNFLPEYDVLAMAFILVTLKYLFGLDDTTEIDISLIAKKINESQSSCSSKQFEWSRWLEYIECRRAAVDSVHHRSFKSTYSRLCNNRLAAQSICQLKKNRLIKNSFLGSKRFALKSNFLNGLQKLPQTPLTDSVTPPASVEEPYWVQWTEELLTNHSEKLHPSMRDILSQDFTTTKLDFLDPQECEKMFAKFNQTIEIHKGRSKRCVIIDNRRVDDFYEVLPKEAPSEEFVHVPIFNDNEIQEEISVLDEAIVKEVQQAIGNNQETLDKRLILYLPRYEYWTIQHKSLLSIHNSRYKYFYKRAQNFTEMIQTLCSVNFVHLLNFCSEMIRTQPHHLYASICVLEQNIKDE